MKRIITLLLVGLMLVAVFPVSAERITVSITSVKIGDVFTVGSVVPLTVETNESMLTRVDYYANGAKIPGTSTEAGKPVLWKPEAPGTYALTAKVFSKADTVIGSDSTVVTVNVVDPSVRYLMKADKAADLSNFHNNWLDEVAAVTSTNYTKFGNVSAEIGPLNNSAKQYAFIRNLSADLGPSENRNYSYINYSVYATKPVTLYSTLTDSTEITRPASSGNGGWISFNEGWNTVSVAIDATTIDGYWGPRLTDISKIAFYTCYGYDIPEGFVNHGYKINTQPDLASAYLYFDAVWLSKTAATKPQVVKTSIPDEETHVYNGLTKYSITFDQEMRASTIAKESVTVVDKKGGSVPVANVRVSGKTLDVFFAKYSFAYNEEYTISLNKNIESARGVAIGEGVSFDFTVVNSGISPKPIPSMTYPVTGSTVASNNAVIAAEVVFDDDIDEIAFYEETGETDTLLAGTPQEGSENEYYLSVSDFEVGEHTVYAKVTYNNSKDTVYTAPVSFMVSEAKTYALAGISDGETIAVNEGDKIVLTRTVGLNTTEDVTRVIYSVDGVETATIMSAPFSWDMPINDVNEHTVSAKVIDVMGYVQNVPAIRFKGSYLVTNNVLTDDFDEEVTVLHNQTPTKSTISFVDDPAEADKRDGKVAYIDYTGGFAASSDDSCHVKSFTIPASKQVRIDLDMFIVNTSNRSIWMNVRPATYSYTGFGAYRVSSQSGSYKVGDWNEVSILVDFSQYDKTSYKTYVNGALSTSGAVEGTQFHERGGKFTIHLMSQADYYVDNLKVYDYVASTLDVPAVGKVSFAENSDGWDANFNVINFASEARECILYTAVYDDNDNLVSASGEVVPMVAGEIVNKMYTVSKENGDQTGTKIRGFVLESASGVTTCRPLRELN